MQLIGDILAARHRAQSGGDRVRALVVQKGPVTAYVGVDDLRQWASFGVDAPCAVAFRVRRNIRSGLVRRLDVYRRNARNLEKVKSVTAHGLMWNTWGRP